MAKLKDLASTIRSKNAGVDHITFDVLFRDRASFERVRDSAALTPKSVARLFGIEQGRISEFIDFEPANAIKFTIRRSRPSGSPGEHDLYGSQQYAPLFEVEVP
jgi:hypothetical protein